MNIKIVNLINKFSSNSQNYNLSGNVNASICYFNFLANEWATLKNQNNSHQLKLVTNEIHKNIIHLVEIFPTCRISNDLIEIFSEKYKCLSIVLHLTYPQWNFNFIICK